jgi:hypothetical protein
MGDCSHEYFLLIQFGLSCQYWIIRSFLKEFPLPLSLVHPRWWLSGSPMHTGKWMLGYYDVALDSEERLEDKFANKSKDLIIDSVHEVLSRQSHLLSEDTERIAMSMVAHNTEVMVEINSLEERNHQIPGVLPEPRPPRTNLQYKKSKESTRKRALTGAEAVEQQERVCHARTRLQVQAQIAEAAVQMRRSLHLQNTAK